MSPSASSETIETAEEMEPTPPNSPSRIWIGQFNDPKPPHTYRILFHNVNSLQGNKAFDETLPILLNEQVNLKIDYMGITEHCLNLHYCNTSEMLHRSVKWSTTHRSIHQFNCGIMHTTSTYLPGGTAAILLGENTGRVDQNGKGGDNMGRWSYVTLQRRHNKKLTIITAYQVNRRPSNDIGITAWHQQRLQLNNQGRHQVHPRVGFIDDRSNSSKDYNMMNTTSSSAVTLTRRPGNKPRASSHL